MITNHRKVVWAEELGIDLKELRKEHPDHWEQIMMKKRLGKRAENYWAKERFLSQLHDRFPDPEAEHTPSERKPVAKKAGKVRRYEFTEAQLEIARRSLSGRDSV